MKGMSDTIISTASDQINAVLLGLRRVTTQLEQVSFAPTMEHVDIPIAVADRDIVASAERLLQERRKREKFFDADSFGEPVWDILLDLYVAKMRGRQISVSSACIAAHVPPTTALRYIVLMTKKGDVVRVPDEYDSRRVYLELSDKKMASMTDYLSAIAAI
jgi:DNA-binding MarR family transcriptional regulator